MATKTGSSYTTGTATDSVEIPTASPGFSTMASPNKVSPSDYDNDRQPEMVCGPKPEILIYLELWQIGRQFQRQIWWFRPRPAPRIWPRATARTTDNRKWQYIRLGQQILQHLVVDCCGNHLANLLSSWTSSRIPNFSLEFRHSLSEFQSCNYFRFWRPYIDIAGWQSLLHLLAETIFHLYVVLYNKYLY